MNGTFSRLVRSAAKTSIRIKRELRNGREVVDEFAFSKVVHLIDLRTLQTSGSYCSRCSNDFSLGSCFEGICKGGGRRGNKRLFLLCRKCCYETGWLNAELEEAFSDEFLLRRNW